ncbi:MAG: hypothetical protein CR986_07825 [Ignavibacteriae bacterium]|nr:MAG: hypothetical protein CR986_07825 [Ignavibacteriota bacterium]
MARLQPEDSFSIVPARVEDCGRGDHRLSAWQQYDLFEDFENNLDKLAIDLGGVSLSNKETEDLRTKNEKLIRDLFNNAIVFYYTRDFEKSLNLFTLITDLQPDSHGAWNNKGNALDGLGRQEEAIAAYDKALEIKPDSHEAWYNKGDALDALGRQEAAIAAYDKALEIKPDDHEAWDNKGTALFQLGRQEAAIAAYDKALEIKPDDHRAWNNKGNALNALGRLEEAIEAYDKALEIKPDKLGAWYNKGNTLDALGRQEEAIEAYKKALYFSEKNNSSHSELIRKTIDKLKAEMN